jgi:hypothetical protein
MFVMPTREQAGYLPPEIAGEGQKVILGDGETVNWSPPPNKPIIPDISNVKSIRKYFNRIGYQVWPAWLYHPTEPARLAKTAHEAAELGVCYREASNDEKGRYGRSHVWDWKDDSLWRPTPYAVSKARVYDPLRPEQGKEFRPTPPNPIVAQDALLERLLPAIAAAVAKEVRKPDGIDPRQWDSFLKFQAFQKAQEALENANSESREEDAPASELALSTLSPEQERAAYEAEAEKLGIKTDGRWSLDKLKNMVKQAQKAA